MSVKRAQREVDSREFAEWMAYADVEPFGPEREDYRAGVIAALTANVNRDPKQRQQPYDVEDFFPRYGHKEAPPAEVTEDALSSKLTAWALAMAGDGKGERPKSELRKKR